MESPVGIAANLVGLRVLIVEDEPLVAMSLSEVIEAEGCIIAGEAGTIADALAIVATATFDVAVLDLNLHGKQADEVASAILLRGRAVVFATGSGASGVASKFHGWPILCKPYTDEAVLASLAGARRWRQSAKLVAS